MSGSASKLAGIASKFGVELPTLTTVTLGVLEREVPLRDGTTVHQRVIANPITVKKVLASTHPADFGWTLAGKAPGAKLQHKDAPEPAYIVLAISSLEQMRDLTDVQENTEDSEDSE